MLNIKKEIENRKEDLIQDIAALVSIPSVRDMSSAEIGAPFGKGIQNVFHDFNRIAKREGFMVENFDGYAVHACSDKDESYIGVLAHLDVVEAGNLKDWKSDPFCMVEHDGMLYGRGVNDDKGPLIAALYAASILMKQKLPMKYPIRIIAGGAEETTWECMEHYFSKNVQPVCGFSPDGNFPIVNGEKGILQVCFSYHPTDCKIRIMTKKRLNYVCDELLVELPDTAHLDMITHADKIERYEHGVRLHYHGTAALSRNPQKGDNAMFYFVKDFIHYPDLDTNLRNMVHMIHNTFEDDFYGEKSGLYSEDNDMGTTSVCPMSLNWNHDTCELCLDVRYVKSTNKDNLIQILSNIAIHWKAELSIINHKRLLYVEEDSALINGLKNAYHKVTGDKAEVFTKGGASYARVLDHGVAFGATFPQEDPCVHMPNEHMPIASLLKACEIYYEALYELAVDHEQLAKEKISD